MLLLDEPLSNLDAKLRVRLREEIVRLQKVLGKTMVFVTHDQEEALSISDQIAVMKEGRIAPDRLADRHLFSSDPPVTSPNLSGLPTSLRPMRSRWDGFALATRYSKFPQPVNAARSRW